jgi:pyrroline-5-carboxylate reductase
MKKIGFIGAGNMAGALIRGLLASQRYKADDMWVSDPVDSQVRRLKRAHKVDGTRDNRLLVRQSQAVILAVKPQMMAQVLEEIRPEASPKKLFVSIAAGFPLRRLETGLGGQSRVVRVMPNTPVLVGKGISVAVAGSKATPADLKQTLKLFGGRRSRLIREDPPRR